MIVVGANVMKPLRMLPDAQAVGHGDQIRTVQAAKQYQDWQF
jgi:hypothetical protein